MSTRPGRRELLTSTIALKVAMAVSGLGLVGFVLFHMLGNLQVFQGREAFNDYAAFMQGLGGVLWIARAGLLGLLAVHVLAATKLTIRNQDARPQGYRRLEHRKTSVHARFMIQSGVVVFFYILYHLAHFTFGWIRPEGFALTDADGRPDVYTNLVLSFQVPMIAVLYIVANATLASHLAHAVTSMFKTLGVAVGRSTRAFEMIGPAIGTVIFVGNLSMPIACLLGLLTTKTG